MSKRLISLCSLLATALGARLAMGQAYVCQVGRPQSSDHTLCMASSAISAGTTSDGSECLVGPGTPDCSNYVNRGFMLNASIGNVANPVSGGGYQLWPGVVTSITSPRANTSAAHAYPTPYMPSQGHDHITFSDLPPNVIIKVFTLSGHLVKTLTKADTTDSLVWKPVANEQGSALASGVYFFIVSQPGVGEKKGKLMIIR